MRERLFLASLLAAFGFMVTAAQAELSLATSGTGNDVQILREVLKAFEEKTGEKVNIVSMPQSTSDQFTQYRLWLSAQNPDVDVYSTDVIWPPQLAKHFVDLTPYAQDIIKETFPSVIQSQTIDGHLIAVPSFTDTAVLFYRKDLLAKYNKPVPKTWAELTATAKEIMEKERAASNKDMYGFVFQGAPYEGLTCDALEWVASNGGGQIVDPDGTITINNDKAVKALELAKSWVGTIAPQGVLSYKEEDARGVWQLGNAVFMRNWAYAYALGNSADSPIKGKFDIAPLPKGEAEGATSAAALGGWNWAVSKYSKHQKEAIELVKYLASAATQKYNLLAGVSGLPTVEALYDDPDLKARRPDLALWKEVLEHTVPRPSAPTKTKYNEVSSLFWTAVHNTLAGRGSATDNLDRLEGQLTELQGGDW
ncbi:MAG TPA: ABC transporter substrate-binding protein [Beijerinckia sp.]|jgi:trehalose/maltose transport system substrate-binding protein|nr:ABC transporter substrate-binding protein [Beijerinckia sp.]